MVKSEASHALRDQAGSDQGKHLSGPGCGTAAQMPLGRLPLLVRHRIPPVRVLVFLE